MPQVFESLNPLPSVVSTTGDELQSLASRARQRQQEILKNNPVGRAGNPFPVQSVSGTLPNLLGRGDGQTLAQPQGLQGVTNVNVGGQRRIPPSEQRQASVGDFLDAFPTSAPTSLEPHPLDTPYTDLSPTQRNSALRSLGVRVGDFALDAKTGQAHRTDSGALVLQAEVDGGDKMFLAEDGIGAHAVMARVARKLGIGAVPRDSTKDLGYTVAWVVPRGREDQFLAALGELQPENVVLENGEIHVTFGPEHGLNRTFMQSPFGSSKPLTDGLF